MRFVLVCGGGLLFVYQKTRWIFSTGTAEVPQHVANLITSENDNQENVQMRVVNTKLCKHSTQLFVIYSLGLLPLLEVQLHSGGFLSDGCSQLAHVLSIHLVIQLSSNTLDTVSKLS